MEFDHYFLIISSIRNSIIMIEDTYKIHRRFDRLGRLMGDRAVKRLLDSNVVVIGAPAPPAYVETLPSNGSSVVLWGPAQSLHTPVTSFVISTDPPHAPDVTILAEDIGGGEMSINQTTTIHGLSNSVGYTFTVVAHNEIGASPPALSDVAYPLGG